MIVYSLRDIKAGEELFLTYKELPDYEERKAKLEGVWGIDCECLLCQEQRDELVTGRSKSKCESLRLKLYKTRDKVKFRKVSVNALEPFYDIETLAILTAIG